LLLAVLSLSLSKGLSNTVWSIKRKVALASAIALLFIDSFISFGYPVTYLTDGIDWVHANTPENSRIISNERKVTYSIAREKTFEDSEAIFANWQYQKMESIIDNYDYFVEDTFWNKEELMPSYYPDATEIARFTSTRGNRFVVYKIHGESGS